jgi:hypothetical protein
MAGGFTDNEPSAGLLLRYEVTGDVAALAVPASATPGAADGLWQHTCFEAFVAVPGEPAYREFNFSPSGQWAAYRFFDERVRDTAAELAQPPVEPQMDVEVQAHALVLQVWLPRSALPMGQAGGALQLGLSAVIEDQGGQLSYWALQHPAARPDFHHRGGMALSLALPFFDSPPAFQDTP